jgi:hypothetical protein
MVQNYGRYQQLTAKSTANLEKPVGAQLINSSSEMYAPTLITMFTTEKYIHSKFLSCAPFIQKNF